MKKLPAVVVLAVAMLMPHFAIADESAKVKQLYVEKAELVVRLVECQIENLNMTQTFLDFQLSILTTLAGSSIRQTADEAKHTAERVRVEVDEARKAKNEKLELLRKAKLALQLAKSNLE